MDEERYVCKACGAEVSVYEFALGDGRCYHCAGISTDDLLGSV